MNEILSVSSTFVATGSIENLREFIDSFYGDSVIECEDVLTGEMRETNLTFNSYAVANNEEEAIKKWGFKADTLGSSELTFNNSKRSLDEFEENGAKEGKIKLSFSTSDFVNIDWVKEVIRRNPNIEIKYSTMTWVDEKYIGYSFELNGDEVTVNEKAYDTISQLYVEFFDADVETIFDKFTGIVKIDSGLWNKDMTSGDKKLIEEHLRDEFRFLSKKEFGSLTNKFVK